MSGWTKGQAVSIDGGPMLHVERVTPAGRAIVGGQTFEPNGWERTGGYHPSYLQEWTPEVEAAVHLQQRADVAGEALYTVLDRLEKWRRQTFSLWNKRPRKAADVERAERLLAALQAAAPTKGEGEAG